MRHVLCIVQSSVPSTEISLIRPFTYLQSIGKLTWKIVVEDQFSPELLKEIDIVIFQRNCRPNSRGILSIVKNAQIPVIYEIDDNFLKIPDNLPGSRYYKLPAVVNTIETFIKLANVVKAGSPEMIPELSQWNKNVVHHPYAVDLSIIDNMAPKKHNNFIIGYAGTIHHNYDFEPIIGAILQVAERFPDIHWEFIGCQPEGLEKINNIFFTKFQSSYECFLRDLYQRGWQIGLAPLKDTPSNRCKTDNKFREYSACGIPGIYSNIPPYSRTIAANTTGLLADNTISAWTEALLSLIQNSNLRLQIAEQSRKWVEQYRSLPAIAELWESLFEMITNPEGGTLNG